MALKSVVREPKSIVNANVFAGQAKQPTEAELAAALGDCHELWQRLLTDLKDELAIDRAEWHTSSVKLGWSMRLQAKKRNIVYLGPRKGFFVASFILGDKAIAAAKKSNLGSHMSRIIAESKRYPEGTAVSIEVRAGSDFEMVRRLAKIKMEN